MMLIKLDKATNLCMWSVQQPKHIINGSPHLSNACPEQCIPFCQLVWPSGDASGCRYMATLRRRWW